MQTGVMTFLADDCRAVLGERVALLCNHTSVGPDFLPTWFHLHSSKQCNLIRLFSPEHGLWGVAQDQELVEGMRDEATGLEVISLYGGQLSPVENQLRDLDTVIFDIQDIGSRYYTFIYSMLMTMEVCGRLGIRFLVLDRPNPLGGLRREGNILEEGFTSFVGLYPLPVVHGMTVAEIAQYINERFELGCRLSIIRCEGWRREQFFDQTGLPWIVPSPNMPSLAAAIVYPGCCLFEATTISEGRGTTLPFELVGAPWIDPYRWAAALKGERIPGVAFRPHYFRPLTNKYAGQICGGLQIHVIDRESFPAYYSGLAMIATARRLFPEFAWREPPYEFEMKKMPIDILAGTDRVRTAIDAGIPLSDIAADWIEPLNKFERDIENSLLY